MTPTLQLVLVAAVVAAAALYVARSVWKTWAGKSVKGCGAGCGKCVVPAAETKVEGRFPLPQA